MEPLRRNRTVRPHLTLAGPIGWPADTGVVAGLPTKLRGERHPLASVAGAWQSTSSSVHSWEYEPPGAIIEGRQPHF